MKTDTLGIINKKKIGLNLDIVSRYLWRGQCWGGNYIAVQPSVDYFVTPKLTVGFWGTTNFKNGYFSTDAVPENKGYQEIDLYVYYKLTDFLEFQIWDYYWPPVSKVDGVKNGYFNYGTNGTKSVDAMVCLDFSEGYKYPFNATLSTLVAGNDFRYDSNGENPKQNFTTYFEVGYTFTVFENHKSILLQDIDIDPMIGVIFNNKAEYYTYADYDKVSFVDLGLNVSKEFELGHGIKMPVMLTYTHNAASKNTEFYGKDFLVGCLSFKY
ncbi:MAG: hypothetical protein M0D53_13500 [Flavobacterium sp. JAD_PAG50586_2]|nr:MAG: hypothetical protein M0D53_13500 [Flavobacterium sp. JAD_PAG50586_2]